MCDRCIAKRLAAGAKIQYSGGAIQSKTKKTIAQNNILNEILLFDWSYKDGEDSGARAFRLGYQIPSLVRGWQRRLLEDFTKPNGKQI